MPEFLNKISGQITDFWNKFSNKQKIQMIATAAVGIIALVVLVVLLNRPNLVLLQDELDPKSVNIITEQLIAAGIPYEVGEDAGSVYVEAALKKDATLALADVGIISNQGMTYADAFNNSIMTSDYEKALKYQLYFEAELARKIEIIESIENAQVTLVIPDEDRSILDDAKQSKASVLITTNGDINEAIVESIARFVETSVQNLELENVTVIDSIGRLLFNGEARAGGIQGVSGADYELQKELVVRNNVRSILLSGGEYDDAFVAVDLVVDFDQLQKTTETHTTQDGSNTGILDTQELYLEESTNTNTGGTPGTDANGVTDTLIGEGGESNVVIEERKTNYKYNTEVATIVKAIGGVLYDQSTVTVSLTKYKLYDQAILENQADGPMGDMTWEEFKFSIIDAGNRKIPVVDPDIIDVVKLSSNIDNVKVIAYESPRFIEKIEEPQASSDYILIGIIIVMILLLGYAVYKGTEPVEIKDLEPELSVEDMLATTKQTSDLEAIEFDGKSDARIQIENFVDHNPDAVALLLRNWLNEDWE
jgi:flagellar M-ring protein FliF